MGQPFHAAKSARHRLDPWRGAPRSRPQSHQDSARVCRGCPGPTAHPTSARRPARSADCGWASSWREGKGTPVVFEVSHFVASDRDGVANLLRSNGAVVLDYGAADCDIGSINARHSREGSEHGADAMNAGHARDRDGGRHGHNSKPKEGSGKREAGSGKREEGRGKREEECKTGCPCSSRRSDGLAVVTGNGDTASRLPPPASRLPPPASRFPLPASRFPLPASLAPPFQPRRTERHPNDA